MEEADEHYTFSDSDLDKFMNEAKTLVVAAAELIKSGIGKTKAISQVDLKDFNISEGNASAVLTETDIAVEKLITEGLKKAFPDHCFIGEEGIGAEFPGKVNMHVFLLAINSFRNINKSFAIYCIVNVKIIPKVFSILQLPLNAFTNKPTWIIDPIDGTMNFVHSNPLVVTSVGLAINKKLVLGIINAPIIGHMYTAVKGQGAFLNGEKIHASSVKKLGEALVIMEISVGGNERKKNVCLSNLAMLSEKAHAIRCPGPAALDIAWVGGGSADAYFHSGFHCWDMAAGIVIVREAGGVVYAVNGDQADLMSRGILVAASEELAMELSKSIEIYAVDPEYPLPCPV